MSLEDFIVEESGVSVPLRGLVYVYGLDDDGEPSLYQRWINFANPDEGLTFFEELSDLAFLRHKTETASIIQALEEEQ